MVVLSPRESADIISRIARHVVICHEAIERIADMAAKCFQKEGFTLSGWWKCNELNPQDHILPFTIDWIFLVDTLNFSFWGEEGKQYKVTFKGKTYTGYWSLCAAVNRALDEGYEITSPDYYRSVPLETLRYIFRSDDGLEIPLLEERYNILQETGKCLVEKFRSSFTTCVAMANNSVERLLKIILENFPSYRDEATIESHEVSFYKRAQILIADIWLCFEGKRCGAFNDIESLTIFADYRIPQVLVFLGAMGYSPELMTRIRSKQPMENGHRFEVEIRGCTIKVCELIYEEIKAKQRAGKLPQDLPMNNILIDNFLWEYRRKNAKRMEHVPFHKVRCVYY